MEFLSKLERKLGRFAIPNLTMGLVALQVVGFAIFHMDPARLNGMLLLPDAVMQGELWRLGTFLALPMSGNLIVAFIGWSATLFCGNALEQSWGTARFNVYMLVGYLSTIAAAVVLRDELVWNSFVQVSIFFAFAYVFPDYQFRLYFLVPIKARYLAIVWWMYLGFEVYKGSYSVLTEVASFLFFFGPDIVRRIMRSSRRVAVAEQARVAAKRPFHRCLVCGITDKTNPEMEFRYCSKCYGACGYCSRHLHAHEHVAQEDDTTQQPMTNVQR